MSDNLKDKVREALENSLDHLVGMVGVGDLDKAVDDATDAVVAVVEGHWIHQVTTTVPMAADCPATHPVDTARYPT